MHVQISHTHRTNLQVPLRWSKNSHFLVFADIRTVGMLWNVFPSLHKNGAVLYEGMFLIQSTCILAINGDTRARGYNVILHSAEFSGEGKS